MSIYIFISYQHHFMRRFIPTKEKNVVIFFTPGDIDKKVRLRCINLNQSHLSAESVSLKVSFALFTKGCPIGLLKHPQATVK